MKIDRDAQYRNEAAWVTLRPMLESKTLGDHVTAQDIAAATGFEDWGSFRQRIRSFYFSRGVAIEAVPNDGYRLVAANEYKNVAAKHRDKATRSALRRKHILDSTPTRVLTERELRLHDFESRQANAVAGLVLTHDLERKNELRASSKPERGVLADKAAT